MTTKKIKMDRGDYAFLRGGKNVSIEIDAPLRVEATMDGAYAVELRQRLREGIEHAADGETEASVTLDMPVEITVSVATARKLLGDLDVSTNASGVPLKSH